MAGALKFEGRLSLQFEGPGAGAPACSPSARTATRIRGVARHDALPPDGASGRRRSSATASSR